MPLDESFVTMLSLMLFILLARVESCLHFPDLCWKCDKNY